MSALGDDYLRYPTRRYGQDHARYGWRLSEKRKPKRLADGKALAVAFIVPLEFFMLNPSGKPFRHPGALQTPYPDLRHYTTRDYGNRIGAFRMLKVFREARLTVTFAINAVLLERVRPLIDAILEDGHEIAAHGYDTDSIHWGSLAADVERRYVDATRTAFDKAGVKARAWMSPARQQSFETPDLIREAGFDVCLDWEVDNTPVSMSTTAGPLAAFPVFNELDDRLLLTVKNCDEASWRDQILEAAAMMKGEYSRYGSQCLGVTMTPYIVGQPFRIHALRELASAIAEDDAIITGGVSSLADAFA